MQILKKMWVCIFIGLIWALASEAILTGITIIVAILMHSLAAFGGTYRFFAMALGLASLGMGASFAICLWVISRRRTAEISAPEAGIALSILTSPLVVIVGALIATGGHPFTLPLSIYWSALLTTMFVGAAFGQTTLRIATKGGLFSSSVHAGQLDPEVADVAKLHSNKET